MAADIGPKIGLQGEQQFKNAIKDINQSLKTLDSEMKLVTSEFDKNDTSMAKLNKQNAVYEKQLYTLNDKLKVQGERLKEAAAAYGEADSRTMKLQQDYNKTQAEINNLNHKIEANNQALKQNNKYSEIASKSFKAVGVAAAATAAAIAAAAAAALKIVKSFSKMAVEAGKAADELVTLSKQTGLSTDELQRYQFAADRIDVSLDTITGSMTKLTRNMSSASKGSKTASAAFAKLGVAVTDSNGELRDRNEVFKETINALGKIENVTERDAVAMDIFGKSAQELNPLILGGADALEQFGDEAQRAGLILSSGQLNNLNLLNDAMDRLSVTWSKAKMLFASTFSAEMGATIDLVTDAVQRLTKAFSEGGIEQALAELPMIVEDLAGDLSEKVKKFGEIGGELLKALAKGISIMAPALVPAALEALDTFVEAILEPDTLKAVLEAAGQVVITFAKGVISNLPLIVTTAWDLLKELVRAIGDAIVSLIPDEGRQLVTNFIDGIKSYFSNLFQTGKNIVTEMGSGVKENLSETWKWGKDLIDGFIGGIKQKWQDLKNACSSTAKIVKNFLGFSVPEEGPLSDAYTYGPDFMKLYAKGISDNAWRVKNAVDGVANDMQISPDAQFAASARNSTPDWKIYLSTGELVGGIAKTMNNTLGRAYVQDVRGAMA